jgi:hypothetical protein
MNKNKHIHSYLDFILEQDMMAPSQPDPNQKPKVIEYRFIFISGPEDTGVSRRKYQDGSIVIEYPCYSITQKELKEWANDNIIQSDKNKLTQSELEVRKNSLFNIVKGDRLNISHEDYPNLEKLKSSVSSNLIGKTEPDVTVVYSKGVPTTEDIDVTFIKYKK